MCGNLHLRNLQLEGRIQKTWLCMSANNVVVVRCEDLRSEAELRSVDSDVADVFSESGMSSSVSSVSSACGVYAETNEVHSESSTEFSCSGAQVVRDEADSGLFCAKLYKKHRAEAAAYVEKCRREGKNPLDACGERGDLFFLIQSEWGAFGVARS